MTADVAIVGAGPYGLSIAAHLQALGLSTHVFGQPMQTWGAHMPPGMVLKSEGFATSLSDPNGELTLEKFCRAGNLPYQSMGLPVPLDIFIQYGLAFQRRFVPDLDQRLVHRIERMDDGFRLNVGDESEFAHRVIVAAGIRQFDYLPPKLAALTATGRVSHSSRWGELSGFADRSVLVVGAGSSATDIAALLHQNGARTSIVARRAKLPWAGGPEPMTLAQQIKYPVSGLGTGWRSLACCKAPMIFFRMPEKFRAMVVRKHLGPAPGYFTRDIVEQHVEQVLGALIVGAHASNNKIILRVKLTDGTLRDLTADHLIAATGYRVDLRKLDFLADLLPKLSMLDYAPRLSPHFQSSVEGLYFAGTSAALSFGPMLRFVYGADWTARRIARHLVKTTTRAVRFAATGDPTAAFRIGSPQTNIN